jgi:hypothetical protein
MTDRPSRQPVRELPTQQQVRPDPKLTEPELQMLKYEADPNYQMDIPELSTNIVIRWVRKVLGITAREERIFLELQRLQALIVILAQHAQGIRPDHDAVAESVNAMNRVLGEELIPQVNRQTNGISSLLDRLQFYERNSDVFKRLRKLYDKKIAELVAKQARAKVAETAQAEGIVLGDDGTQPDTPTLELVTDDGSAEPTAGADSPEDDDDVHLGV